MLTSKGICYTYNAKSVSQIFKPTTQRGMFLDAFNIGEEKTTVYMSKGDGEEYGLTFYLDANTRMRPKTDTPVGDIDFLYR